MDLSLNTELAAKYIIKSQQARVMTEAWVSRNLYCPNCGQSRLCSFTNNRRASDFYCISCKEKFELKSGKRFGKQIVNGAFAALSQRVLEHNNPNLILLRFRDDSNRVDNLELVPREFFIPAIIAPRTPLSANARRAGWIGCNILIGEIPTAGRVGAIHDGIVVDKSIVLDTWARTRFLRNVSALEPRGWLIATMRIVDRFANRSFSLAEVYAHEAEVAQRFPGNKNVRAKLRQQLQVLRDRGVLVFLEHGRYQELQSARDR